MSAEDLAVAQEFLDVLAAAANSGEHDAVYPLLAPDVEWRTPQRTLRGLDEVRAQPTWPWISPRGQLEAEFDEQVTDLGGGVVVSNVRMTYRIRGTGDFAYARDRRIELTIRRGKVARYELRFAG